MRAASCGVFEPQLPGSGSGQRWPRTDLGRWRREPGVLASPRLKFTRDSTSNGGASLLRKSASSPPRAQATAWRLSRVRRCSAAIASDPIHDARSSSSDAVLATALRPVLGSRAASANVVGLLCFVSRSRWPVCAVRDLSFPSAGAVDGNLRETSRGRRAALADAALRPRARAGAMGRPALTIPCATRRSAAEMWCSKSCSHCWR
mmetsp:Transcript_10810/g.34484  ORF Transcript_10810/g.34484 Transcript_10810/m.34484 type:complete len:205 (-) Transcript_10810:512-1126(-)